MKSEIKKTPLHDWHAEQGANMSVFGGYEMPLWYPSGAKKEHLAVLSSAGLFDTSHMSGVLLKGTGAFDLLQHLVTKDLNRCIGIKKTPLVPGRCVYGAFLNEQGHVIDDTIIFQLGENRYLVYVNAGMGGPIASHLASYKDKGNVEIKDLTDKLGKIDIQGPNAAKILKCLLKEPDTVLNDMLYFSFKGDIDFSRDNGVELVNGDSILLSRTGYTGEFGFELFLAPEKLVTLWRMMLDAGKEHHLTTCGLAARDSLRAGAVLPLSHQDIGAWPYINHPWPFALPFDDDEKEFTKSFLGNEALRNSETVEYTYPYVGYDLRKVACCRQGGVQDDKEKIIGCVSTCVSDMGIGRHEGRVYSITSPDKPEGFSPKGLSCGFVRVERPFRNGETVILIDDRRAIKVEIVQDIRPDRTARRPMKKMLD